MNAQKQYILKMQIIANDMCIMGNGRTVLGFFRETNDIDDSFERVIQKGFCYFVKVKDFYRIDGVNYTGFVLNWSDTKKGLL